MEKSHLIQAGDTLIIESGKAITALHHTSQSGWSNTFWASIVLIALIIFFITIAKSSYIKSILLRKLPLWALGVWFVGFILYCIGFDNEGSANFITLALRATISSIEMFASHSDLIEVKHSCHESSIYMLLFAITHFMAVVVSAAFIVHIMGLRLISKISLIRKCISFRISIFSKLDKVLDKAHNEDWYVFWGVNHNSILLANSIKSQDIYKDNEQISTSDKQQHKRKCCILFVNLPSKNHSHSSHFHLSHLFHTLENGVEKYVSAIEEMGALLINAKRPFTIESFKGSPGNVRIFKNLGISFLGISFCDILMEILLLNKKNNVKYFFLSDNIEANIAAISALKSVYANAEKDSPIKCYCHARSNSINSALLNCPGLNGQIYLLDSSSLAVLSLKKNAENHPVNFIDIDSKACLAKSPFTAMVIGFGEAGRDAFRFLYEFASIPQNDSGDENPKTIYVVDKHLNSLKANFLKDTPALASEDKLNWWIDASTHSNRFWDNVKAKINALNYIVIAIDNDDEAMNLAADIFEFAYRYRENLQHFKIYVRIRNGERYNDIKKLYDSYIVPFGNDESIFSYNIISMDVVEQGAKKFYYAYKKVKEDDNNVIERIKFNKKKIEEEWENRRDELNSITEDVIQNKANLIKLHYQEAQDISNYYHIITKRYLADWDCAGELSDTQLVNLANCEHLRWNAKMELLGFVYGVPKDKDGKLCSKDFQRRIHRCLTDCKTLKNGPDADTQKYDKTIVNVSFRPEFDQELS